MFCGKKNAFSHTAIFLLAQLYTMNCFINALSHCDIAVCQLYVSTTATAIRNTAVLQPYYSATSAIAPTFVRISI